MPFFGASLLELTFISIRLVTCMDARIEWVLEIVYLYHPSYVSCFVALLPPLGSKKEMPMLFEMRVVARMSFLSSIFHIDS